MDIVGVKAHSDKDEKIVARYVASRMMFTSDNHLRIITDGAFDCLFEIPDKYLTDESTQLKLLSYTKLDNYKMDSGSEQNHALLDKIPLDLGSTDVFDRLLRKNHEQKSWFDQCEIIGAESSDPEKSLTTSSSDTEEESPTKRPDVESLVLRKVKQIFGINYDFHTDSESDAFVAEFSFTVLDWIILDKILHTNKPFTLEDIDSE